MSWTEVISSQPDRKHKIAPWNTDHVLRKSVNFKSLHHDCLEHSCSAGCRPWGTGGGGGGGRSPGAPPLDPPLMIQVRMEEFKFGGVQNWWVKGYFLVNFIFVDPYMPSRNAVYNFIQWNVFAQLLKTSLVCMMDAFKASGDPRPPPAPPFLIRPLWLHPHLKIFFCAFQDKL